MYKILTIPLSAVVLLCATAQNSDARERGPSTISGPRSVIDYRSAVKAHAVGDHCRSTICGRPMVTANNGRTATTQDSPVEAEVPSTSGTPLDEPGCRSTYCGKK